MAEKQQTKTTAVPERKKRIPVGTARDILAVNNQDPNYVYRWVNDTPGRIQKFKDGGYEVVTADVEVGENTVDRNTKLGSAVTKAVGGVLTAVLMRIPREWYNEDQKAKEDSLAEKEQIMYRADSDYGNVTVTRRR